VSQNQGGLVPGIIVDILYWGGILTVLAIAYTIDYMLIHLWLYGTATLNIVLDALILASLLSFDALSLTSTILFIKNVRSRANMWILLIYAIGAFVVLTYYTYMVMANHTAILVEVYGQGVVGDKYIGYGIVLYNLGVALLTWLVIQGKGTLDRLRSIPIILTPSPPLHNNKGANTRREKECSVVDVYDEDGNRISEIYNC
jgi:phosphoglycerol transferase MdoB-like AlkP superfamily enzyme